MLLTLSAMGPARELAWLAWRLWLGVGYASTVGQIHLSAEGRAERGARVGCIAGALSRTGYENGLAAAGFAEVSVTLTHQVGDGLHSAIIKAAKPGDADAATGLAAPKGRTTLPMASHSASC